MPYIKKHPFDEIVIDRINDYILDNNLSYRKIARASGMSYQKLYQLLHKNQVIKLREYIMLCDALHEPLDTFIHGVNTEEVE